LLAAHPLLWLVGTWLDPAYDSQGLWIAALTLGLLGWSATSPLQGADPRRRWGGLGLLALTALVRLLGQRLGINILGAAALALDAYAIGLLLNLDRRARPLSPGWLALLFAFCLPLERALQRGLGFALQQLSASGACSLLDLGAPVQCQGTQVQWLGQALSVDLPCSGTRGLLLLLLLYTALAALTRPGPGRATRGALLTLGAAILSNSLRIVALAVGLVHAEALGGIDVLAEPWHSAIGLVTLSLAALPLLIWAQLGRNEAPPPPVPPTAMALPGHRIRVHPAIGLAFLALCLGILAVPPRPLDVARPYGDPQLPTRIAHFQAQPGSLSAQEQSYFTRYGGGATRANFGPHGLLVVSTSAPLRHLHAPEECLTGAGHRVKYLGQTGHPIPSALYRSTDPQGRDWRVAVTYVSERGERTTQVAEAVWRWFLTPGTGWRMVQRTAPWELPAAAADEFDLAVWRALDLPQSPAIAQTLSLHP
jgi:exosortase/archaeosortase family protein